MKRAIILGLFLLATPTAECSAAEEPTYDLQCAYTARDDAPNLSENQRDYDWDQYQQCARVDSDGRVTIDPAHLERVSVSRGFAWVLIHLKGWYYVRPDGVSLSVINYDNGPDHWSEGLVRGRRDDKIVFFNREFEQAFEQRFDWAWPFEEGHALVCEGCELEDSGHEHRALVGGSWWFIDRMGERVEQEDLSEDQIRRLEGGNLR